MIRAMLCEVEILEEHVIFWLICSSEKILSPRLLGWKYSKAQVRSSCPNFERFGLLTGRYSPRSVPTDMIRFGKKLVDIFSDNPDHFENAKDRSIVNKLG